MIVEGLRIKPLGFACLGGLANAIAEGCGIGHDLIKGWL
jgi:hypothetical protein